MKCIVCEKECEDEICEDCDRLMDMLYRKNPQDKEITGNCLCDNLFVVSNIDDTTK